MKSVSIVMAVLGLIVAGCATQTKSGKRLDEASLRTSVTESIAAAQAEDVPRMLMDIAPEWQATLTLDVAGDRRIHTFNKQEYADYLKAAFHLGDYVSLSVTNIVIDISDDGQRASVSVEINQKFAYGNQITESHEYQTNTVRFVDSVPMAVKTEGYIKYTLPSK